MSTGNYINNTSNNNENSRSNSNSGEVCSAPTSGTPTISYKQHYLYHNETLQSFFRRLTFSPDGSILITTCGIYKPNAENGKEEIHNTVYVYTRAGLNRGPVVHLPGLRKPAIVVRFSPVRYALFEPSANSRSDKPEGSDVNVFSLPYRMLFAIATQDSILIYDTQRLKCVAVVTSIHYAVITDVAWSSDGRTVFVSSNDGFISCVVLGEDIVGGIVGGFGIKELQELTKQEMPISAAAAAAAAATALSGDSDIVPLASRRADKLEPVSVVSVHSERAVKREREPDVVQLLKGGEGGEKEGAKRVRL